MTKATTTRTTEHTLVPRSLTHRCCLWLLPVALWASACASPVLQQAPKAAREAPALHHGPPADFISAAGLRWLLLVKPQRVFAEPELARAISEIVPSARFDAFLQASGVELHALPRAAIAGWAYSTLYVAELPVGVAALARARFSERLLSGALTKHSQPGLYRISGVIGQTPETLVTVDDRLLAVAVGDPVPAKVVEGYATQRLKNSPTVLHGAALAALPDLATENVAVLYAPGPFIDEWQRAANGLLESAVALGIGARPLPNGKVATTICIAGDWQSAATPAADRLSNAWRSFARSSLGRLFELDEAAEVGATPELLTLRVELDLAALVRGLKASVFGDLSQILRLPSRTESTPKVPAIDGKR